MRKGFSILLFILAGLTIFAGVGNLVIRDFYNYKPEAWFVIVILSISGLFTWEGVQFWRK